MIRLKNRKSCHLTYFTSCQLASVTSLLLTYVVTAKLPRHHTIYLIGTSLRISSKKAQKQRRMSHLTRPGATSLKSLTDLADDANVTTDNVNSAALISLRGVSVRVSLSNPHSRSFVWSVITEGLLTGMLSDKYQSNCSATDKQQKLRTPLPPVPPCSFTGSGYMLCSVAATRRRQKTGSQVVYFFIHLKI